MILDKTTTPLVAGAFALASALAASAALPHAASAQDGATPLYAATQAEAGKKVFDASCAMCHGAELDGTGEAPQLTGDYFANSWGGHKASELIDFVQGNMPFTSPGSLSEESYLQVVAYILSRNGVPSGDAPLAKGATGVITVARAGVAARQTAPAQASPVTVSFDGTALPDVLAFFARYSGRSIVAGSGVAGTVTAEIANQPWDVALDAVLRANGFVGRELASGIIVVENPTTTVVVPGRVVSRIFRLNYQKAAELEPAVRTMLSSRGAVTTVPSINALVVTDEERVLAQVAAILGQI